MKTEKEITEKKDLIYQDIKGIIESLEGADEWQTLTRENKLRRLYNELGILNWVLSEGYY